MLRRRENIVEQLQRVDGNITALSDELVDEIKVTIICSNCGATYDYSDESCPKCGFQLCFCPNCGAPP